MKVKKFSGVQSFEFVFRLFHYYSLFCEMFKGWQSYLRQNCVHQNDFKAKKSLYKNWVCEFFFIFSISDISSLLNYFALGRYILSKTLMFNFWC